MEHLFCDPSTLGAVVVPLAQSSGLSCLSWDTQLGASFGMAVDHREMLHFFTAADGEGAGRSIKIHCAKLHPHKVQKSLWFFPSCLFLSSQVSLKKNERAQRGSCTLE